MSVYYEQMDRFLVKATRSNLFRSETGSPFTISLAQYQKLFNDLVVRKEGQKKGAFFDVTGLHVNVGDI